MNGRVFAEICLRSAKGEDVQSSLGGLLASGTSGPALADRVRANRVVGLLAGPLHALNLDGTAGRFPSPAFHLSRHMVLRAQLLQLDEALFACGSQVVLLKGSIQLFRPLYPYPGMRDMADIDVLLNEASALQAFDVLGYRPQEDGEAMPRSLDLRPGYFHLPPLVRDRDLVVVEPHILPVSPQFAHLLSPDIFGRARLADGTKTLLLPDPIDQLHLALIHALLHDRDSLHGGLLIRSLVECELLLEALAPDQRNLAKESFAERGGGRLWISWRAFADWCFRRDDSAPKRSPGAWLLINEFKLRASGGRGELAIAIANRVFRACQPSYWSSGVSWKQAQVVLSNAFWKHLYAKLRAAVRG